MPKKVILDSYPSEETLKKLAKEVSSLKSREENTLLDVVEHLQKAIETAKKNRASWEDIAAHISKSINVEISAGSLAHTYNYLKKRNKKTKTESEPTYDELKKNLSEAKKKIEELETELKACKQTIDAFDEDDTAHFHIEIAALKVTLEQTENENKELKKRLEEADYDRQEKEIVVLKKEIETLTCENAALKNDLDVERMQHHSA